MMNIRIAHLYPELLNLYGDRGNVMCLRQRCMKRGIDVHVDEITVGTAYNHSDYDIAFIGGGQDFEQGILLDDLFKGKDAELRNAVKDGSVVLAICGGYQLLGKYYQTFDGKRMDYTGALDLYTVGEKKRYIGNYLYQTDFGLVVGFENHSGRTYLGNCKPLGKIISGFGNNGSDLCEGAHYNNTFCTYSHGPVLPKNPRFADTLISLALERKYQFSQPLEPLDDSVENEARKQVVSLYFKKEYADFEK